METTTFDLQSKQIDQQSIDQITSSWSQEQSRIKQLINLTDDHLPITYIGGVDLSFNKDSNTHGIAYLTILTYPGLEQVHKEYMQITCDKPYVSGYLAFREIDPLKTLLDKLKQSNKDIVPQMLLVDGNGVLHKRGCGLASHLGVICDIPTIGVAKNLYVMLGISKESVNLWKQQEKGKTGCRQMELVDCDMNIHGMAVMAHKGINDPVYVSVGHRVSLKTAVEIVTLCSVYRVPQPIRLADLQSRELARGLFKQS